MATGDAADVGSSGHRAALSDRCPRCVQLDRTCPSCVQRRRYAWSLVNDRGETIDTTATIMKLAPHRVRRLVKEESDRRELARYRCDSIPVQLTRAAIAEALQHDPHLTIAQNARWRDMHQSDFERLPWARTPPGVPTSAFTSPARAD